MNGPPDNGAYLIAAYTIAAVVLLGYAVILFRRYVNGR